MILVFSTDASTTHQVFRWHPSDRTAVVSTLSFEISRTEGFGAFENAMGQVVQHSLDRGIWGCFNLLSLPAARSTHPFLLQNEMNKNSGGVYVDRVDHFFEAFNFSAAWERMPTLPNCFQPASPHRCGELLRAEEYAKSLRYSKAVEAFEAAVVTEPRSVPVLLRLGLLLCAEATVTHSNM